MNTIATAEHIKEVEHEEMQGGYRCPGCHEIYETKIEFYEHVIATQVCYSELFQLALQHGVEIVFFGSKSHLIA